MNRVRRLAPLAFAGAALAGCAHGPPLPPVELLVAGNESGCRFEVEGRVLAAGSLAEAEAMLARAARGWRGRQVTIAASLEIPYKCLGLAIYTLQRQGAHANVGFHSEPPPEQR